MTSPQSAPAGRSLRQGQPSSSTPLLTESRAQCRCRSLANEGAQEPVTLETAYTVVACGLPRGQRAVLQAYVDGASIRSASLAPAPWAD